MFVAKLTNIQLERQQKEKRLHKFAVLKEKNDARFRTKSELNEAKVEQNKRFGINFTEETVYFVWNTFAKIDSFENRTSMWKSVRQPKSSSKKEANMVVLLHENRSYLLSVGLHDQI